MPKLQAQDQATWWDTLVKMQKLLRKAAQACYNTHKMDKEAMHNYFMSGERERDREREIERERERDREREREIFL